MDRGKGEHRRKHPCSRNGDEVTFVTVHGRIISRPKSCDHSVPVWWTQPGIRVVIEGTSIV